MTTRPPWVVLEFALTASKAEREKIVHEVKANVKALRVETEVAVVEITAADLGVPLETGAPVVPIAVSSAKCWPRKGFIKYPGMVDVSIGKPIPSAGRAPDELMREVQEWVEGEMRRLDPEAYR